MIFTNFRESKNKGMYIMKKTTKKLLFATITGLLTSANISANQSAFEQATQEFANAKENYEINPTLNNEAQMRTAEIRFNSLISENNENFESRAQVAESEPNGTFGTADALGATDSGTAAISPAADRDFWSVSGVSVGDVFFVAIDTEFGTAMDTEMNVFENDGSTLIEMDDDSGDGLASSVVTTIPTAGSVFFEFLEFGDNNEITQYEVFQAVMAPGATAAEVEPNDTSAQASPTSDMINTGDIAGSTDFYQVEATAGDRLAVIVDNDDNNDNNLTDIEISVLDTDGTTVLAAEAPFTVTTQNAAIFTAVNTGTHFIQLSDGGSSTGGSSTYRFVVVGSAGTVPVELQNFSID